MGINEILKDGVKYLEGSEYTNPFFEVRMILANIMDKDISYLVAHSDDTVDKDICEEFFSILKRRQNGEPLQYIFGVTEFYGNDFYIDEGVLIPRNDTEISIEVLDEIFKNNNIESFLEIGSGSGIVSVTMAMKYPNTEFTAIDVSDIAIENTIKNIEKYNLNNIKVIKSNLYENIDKSYDIIYSNPPYIKTSEIQKLQTEVKDFEPMLALDGGKDGLYFYRKIIEGLNSFLNHKGFIVFEIGFDQGNDVVSLLNGYSVNIIKDLSGKDRVIKGKKGE